MLESSLQSQGKEVCNSSTGYGCKYKASAACNTASSRAKGGDRAVGIKLAFPIVHLNKW